MVRGREMFHFEATASKTEALNQDNGLSTGRTLRSPTLVRISNWTDNATPNPYVSSSAMRWSSSQRLLSFSAEDIPLCSWGD